MRRVEELLMSPKSGCTVHWLTFIYPHPIVSCKILQLCSSVFARHFAQDDRVNGVAGCPRCHVPQERWPLCRVPRKCVIALHNLIPRTATCRRCRIPRTNVITLHNLTPRTAACRRCRIPRKCVIALHNLIPRTATCRRCRIPRKCVIALHRLIPRTAAAHLLLRNAQNYP